MIDALHDAMAAVATDEAIRAVVLTGAFAAASAIVLALVNDQVATLLDNPGLATWWWWVPVITVLAAMLIATCKATLVLITHDPQLAGRCRRNIRVADGLVIDSVAAGSPLGGTAAVPCPS